MGLSSPTSGRTLHLYEDDYDLRALNKSNFNYQLTKSVSTGGTSGGESNVIWQSLKTPPTANIQWVTEYALNWTAELPVTGANVTIGGDWQACKLGEVFDIDENGLWVSSAVPPKADWMKVGNNKYQYPSHPPTPIYIVVGQKIATDSGMSQWQPIFTDSSALFIDGSAIFQPQEIVTMWFQTGLRTGQVYDQTFGSTNRIDYTEPAKDTHKYEHWTTYHVDDGQWQTSDVAPSTLHTLAQTVALPNLIPALAYKSPSESQLDIGNGDGDEFISFRWVLLSKAVEEARRKMAEYKLAAKLRKKWDNVEVKFHIKYTTDHGKELRIQYGPRKPPMDGGLAEADEPQFFAAIDDDILADIVECAKEGSLPPDTTGKIEGLLACP